jgi:hypothetical protein
MVSRGIIQRGRAGHGRPDEVSREEHKRRGHGGRGTGKWVLKQNVGESKKGSRRVHAPCRLVPALIRDPGPACFRRARLAASDWKTKEQEASRAAPRSALRGHRGQQGWMSAMKQQAYDS